MRIVCLSAEAADICARLGAWDDVVAVSAYASQAGLARRPIVSGFSKADVARIEPFAPELVITFSDVQAGIASDLIRRGYNVLATNQRTLAETATAIRVIGGAIGRPAEAMQLATDFENRLQALQPRGTSAPRVYFEEWPEPLISGIEWVGELIERCGGVDVFGHRRGAAARERTVGEQEVIAANPDIILASWCGRTVDLEAIRRRPGFGGITAVQRGAVHSVDSNLILQPGPRLLEGARELLAIFDAWRVQASPA